MAKVSDVLDVAQVDEPQTSLPEHAGSEGSSQDIFDSTMEQAGLDATFAELAEREGELTAADLRQAVGADAEGMSDAELLAAYKAAEVAQAAGTAGATDGSDDEAPAFKLPFPIYDAQGVKIEDVSKLTVQDLLSGKVQVEYQAMGKSQRKAFADLVRTAANGHYNESKMATLMSERGQAYDQLQKIRDEHSAWAGERQSWNKVLDAALAGNVAPLQQLIQAYATELGKAAPAAAPEAEGSYSPEAIAEGQRYVMTTAQKLASEYGADASEVMNVFLDMINKEPADFLTKEKIEAIAQYELPAVIEAAGYARNGTAPALPQADGDPRDARIAALEKSLAEVKAGQANATTAAVRARAKSAPASGGGSTPGAGDSVPSFKNRAQMKEWLQGAGS